MPATFRSARYARFSGKPGGRRTGSASYSEARGLTLASHHFTVVLEWDADAKAYSAVVPALPGCTSVGATVEEALAHVKEAIALHLEGMEADGEPIPEDTSVIVATVAA